MLRRVARPVVRRASKREADVVERAVDLVSANRVRCIALPVPVVATRRRYLLCPEATSLSIAVTAIRSKAPIGARAGSPFAL